MREPGVKPRTLRHFHDGSSIIELSPLEISNCQIQTAGIEPARPACCFRLHDAELPITPCLVMRAAGLEHRDHQPRLVLYQAAETALSYAL